jgi:hypothetical protein
MRFQSKRWKLVTLVIVLSAGVAVAYTVQGSDDIPKLFGGSDGVQVIREATSVRAYRIVGTSEFHTSLDKYEMRGQPVELSTSQAKALRSLLLHHDSYEWDVAKECLPVYGVRVQFLKRDESVDVLFCFECDVLGVFRDGKSVAGEDFDPIRGKLLEIIKPLFPKDEVIQDLEM